MAFVFLRDLCTSVFPFNMESSNPGKGTYHRMDLKRRGTKEAEQIEPLS